MDDPPFPIIFPNASRAKTLNSCMSPAVHIEDVVLNVERDVLAHTDEETTVRLKGIAEMGAALNNAVEGMIANA